MYGHILHMICIFMNVYVCTYLYIFMHEKFFTSVILKELSLIIVAAHCVVTLLQYSAILLKVNIFMML